VFDVTHWEGKLLFAISASGGLFAMAVAWLTHRGIAAVVSTFVIYARPLADHAWLSRAIAYESAFLWTFCLFSGLLVTSFFVGQDWLSRSMGDDQHRFRRAFGLEPEPLVLLLGNGLLCGLWLLRYRRIVAAIRWSNF
jgi:hypothetical protein